MAVTEERKGCVVFGKEHPIRAIGYSLERPGLEIYWQHVLIFRPEPDSLAGQEAAETLRICQKLSEITAKHAGITVPNGCCDAGSDNRYTICGSITPAFMRDLLSGFQEMGLIERSDIEPLTLSLAPMSPDDVAAKYREELHALIDNLPIQAFAIARRTLNCCALS